MSILNEIFMKIGKTVPFKKNDHVFKQGDMDSNIYFIKEGLLKAYYLTNDGKEFVKSFLDAGDLIGSLRATSTSTPSYFSVLCLEDCEMLCVSFEDLLKESKQNLEASSMLIENLIALSLKKEKREYEFLCLSVQERYEILLKERPEIIDRISLNDTAKYLGITAIALSRIRKRMLE